jgi:hypothetical protein
MADMKVVWEKIEHIVRRKLTESENVTLNDLVREFGSFEDVMITAIRKMINPNIITTADMELCLAQATKINAYLSMVKPTSNGNPYDKMADEIAKQAEGGSNENNNPFAEFAKQIQQQIMAEIMEKMKGSLMTSLSKDNKQPTTNVGEDTKQPKQTETFNGDDI